MTEKESHGLKEHVKKCDWGVLYTIFLSVLYILIINFGIRERKRTGMQGGVESYTSRNVWKGQDAGELTVDVSLCFIPQEAFFFSICRDQNGGRLLNQALFSHGSV